MLPGKLELQQHLWRWTLPAQNNPLNWYAVGHANCSWPFHVLCSMAEVAHHVETNRASHTTRARTAVALEPHHVQFILLVKDYSNLEMDHLIVGPRHFVLLFGNILIPYSSLGINLEKLPYTFTSRR